MRVVLWSLAPCFSMSLGSERSFLTWERGDVEGLLEAQPCLQPLDVPGQGEGAWKPGRELSGAGSTCLGW